MPAYVFYPYLREGPSLMFEAEDLPNDAAARIEGLRVLTEHRSAAEVEIWRGDEMIHRERRIGRDPTAGSGTESR